MSVTLIREQKRIAELRETNERRALRYARSDDMVRELTVRIMQHPDKRLRVAYLNALDTIGQAFD